MKTRIIRSLICFFIRLIAKIDVYGVENFPPMGACVVVGNHLGRLDAFLPFIYIQREDVTMIAAEKYKKVPGLKFVLDALNGVWIDRYNADFRTMREVLKRLKAGGMILIAPEGTRSHSEALIEGKTGASYLVAKMGVPVIPVGIHGSEDSLVKAQFKQLNRAKIVANVGKPFTLPKLNEKGNRDEQLQQATDEIMCHIAAMLPPKYHGVYTNHPRLKELLAESKSEG